MKATPEQVLALAREGSGDLWYDRLEAQRQAIAHAVEVALRRGDLAAVRERAQEARVHAQQRGDSLGERGGVHLLAAASRMGGDLDRARALYLESMRMADEAGSARGVAGEHHNLGYVELHSGNLAEAKEHFRASFEWAAANRDLYLLPYCIADAAVVAHADGDDERAARLLGAADAVFESTGAVPDPDDRVEIDRARSELSTYDHAIADGRRLSTDEAVELARG
jgi:tetratricopeptide (TPR) repeat protein